MIYTEKTIKAIKLMYDVHKDQVDKAGIPYPFHPFTVAFNMKDEVTTCVGLLHDVVEDTDITLDNLREMGFGDEVVNALTKLTHADGQDYYEYVADLSTDPVAIQVKLADLRHNSDLSRLEDINNRAIERFQKYNICIPFLEHQLLLLGSGNVLQAVENAKTFKAEHHGD